MNDSQIAEIARTHGTPIYIYDARVLRKQAQRLQARLQTRSQDPQTGDVLRYAMKANPNLALLKIFRESSSAHQIDACSAGEIALARRAGFQSREITYTSDCFDDPDLEAVVRESIPVNAGSMDMIEQLGKAGSHREITIRINPGFGHGANPKTTTGGEHSKHGIWHADLHACKDQAERHGITITGLHLHIGSGAKMQREITERQARALESLAMQLGPEVRMISAGGGLPADCPDSDLDEYFQVWQATRQRLEDHFQHAVKLEFEPGRFLVAEVGILAAKVCAVKRQGRNHFILLNAGFHTLIRPALYGAKHPMHLVPREGPNGREIGPRRETFVAGPLCESGDLLGVQDLPEAQRGDWLIFQQAGAYGFAMSSNYNSRPKPAEFIVDEDIQGRP